MAEHLYSSWQYHAISRHITTPSSLHTSLNKSNNSFSSISPHLTSSIPSRPSRLIPSHPNPSIHPLSSLALTKQSQQPCDQPQLQSMRSNHFSPAMLPYSLQHSRLSVPQQPQWPRALIANLAINITKIQTHQRNQILLTSFSATKSELR